MTNTILALLSKNPYGMMLATLAHELGVEKPAVAKALEALVASGAVVTEKRARNAAMFSLPNTCEWSTRVAAVRS